MFGAVAAGAVIASQTISLVSVDSDLAADAAMLAAGDVAGAADRTTVRPEPEPEPEPELSTLVLPRDSAHDVQALAKGLAQAEERARTAQEQAESSLEPPTGDSCASSGFGGVASHVAQAGHLLEETFGVEDVIGVASRPGNPTSDHPRGYALDFMVDRSTGDALAAYAEENSEALGVSYVLWRVADHYDHVHISFEEDRGSGLLC